MTDKYIDQDEVLIYGPHAARMIRTRVVGLVDAFDKGMAHLADEIEHATEAVREAVSDAREADSAVRAGARAKSPALTRGLDVLGRFSSHLDAQPKGSVDRKQYFAADGTARGVGRSAHRVLLALNHLATQLKKKTVTVSDAASWHKQVAAARDALAPVIEHAQSAKADRSESTPEVEHARTAWLQVYTAAKAGVECVLRLTGHLDQLSLIFHDLAVPSNAKVTEIPATPSTSAPAPA